MREKMGPLQHKGRLFLVVCLLLTGLLSLSPAQVQAQTAIIDHFTASQGPMSDNSTTVSTTTSKNDASIMGNWRHIILTWTFGPGNVTTNVTAHNLFFSAESQTTGNDLIIWDGNATVLNSFALHQDFTKFSQFVLHLVSTDFGPPNCQLRVFTSAANYSTRTFTIPALSSNLDILIPFNSFGIGGGTGVDWAQVNRIELYIPGVADLDLTIDSLIVECIAPDPVISGFSINGTPFPGPAIITTNPPQNAHVCWTVSLDDGNNSVTVTETPPGVVVYGPTLSDGLQHCIDVNLPDNTTRQFFVDAKNKCKDSNATMSVQFQQKPPPGKVPSLTEWGVTILSLILAVSAIVLLKRKKSVG